MGSNDMLLSPLGLAHKKPSAQCSILFLNCWLHSDALNAGLQVPRDFWAEPQREEARGPEDLHGVEHSMTNLH